MMGAPSLLNTKFNLNINSEDKNVLVTPTISVYHVGSRVSRFMSAAETRGGKTMRILERIGPGKKTRSGMGGRESAGWSEL